MRARNPAQTRKPHRLERYTASPDPDIEAEATNIIGLYLNPPAHAAVLSLVEKSVFHGSDHRLLVLPPSPGPVEGRGFEYKRRGTVSLYAALDVRRGDVIGDTAARHTSREFVRFLDRMVSPPPRGKEIHVILDDSLAEKTHGVMCWLDAQPNVSFHFTPTYSSWLDQTQLLQSTSGSITHELPDTPALGEKYSPEADAS
jgi:hypothetical protein